MMQTSPKPAEIQKKDDWDSVIFLESEWYEDGYLKAGNNVHSHHSYQDGFSNGFIKGFEIGVEIVFLWTLAKNKKFKPGSRFDEIETVANSIPGQNEKNFDFVQQIERLRSNCNSVGIKSISNYIEKGIGKDRHQDW